MHVVTACIFAALVVGGSGQDRNQPQVVKARRGVRGEAKTPSTTIHRRIADKKKKKKKTKDKVDDEAEVPDDEDPVANKGAKRYNTPDSKKWPKAKDWEELESALSSGASLDGPFTSGQHNKYFLDCVVSAGAYNPFAISLGGDGVCMQTTSCSREFCQYDGSYDLPAYVADVRTPEDIGAALEFANKHNIAVSVKTTGHSYQGSSTAKDSLLIWMRNYPKDGTIIENYSDSCGNSHDAVVTINGGEIWSDVLDAVKGQYHMVTGGCNSVSAAGGWLMGCGLSDTSRAYGIGIDQVIDFDVVLADGTVLENVDACSEPDLFWALRGGGGGTFGVVTRIHYKLHPVTPIATLRWEVSGSASREREQKFKRQWLTFWTEKSPYLENRWAGGSFTGAGCRLKFAGTEDEARSSDFFKEFEEWYQTVLDTSGFDDNWGAPLPSISGAPSWYEDKGGAEAYYNEDSTITTGVPFSILDSRQTARLMPRQIVIDRKEEVIELLIKNSNSFIAEHPVNYFLGGIMTNVPASETAVHPAMRETLWSLMSWSDEASQMIRDFVPNGVSAASFNHHYVLEPDWRNALWGPNYSRLAQLKKRYDPNHVFNCWHCIGYQGEELVP